MQILDYKNILDNFPYAIFLADRTCNVTYVNNTFRKIFKPCSEKGLIGDVICCADTDAACGEGSFCRVCEVRRAFGKAINDVSPTFMKKIVKSFNFEGQKKNMSFNLTVKPLSNDLFMAILEDTLEIDFVKELQKARVVQQQFLPDENINLNKKYSYLYMPCGEVSGDLLDVFHNKIGACGFVSDISGKGIGAGMLSSFIKAAYDKNLSPANALKNVFKRFKELKTDETAYITMVSIAINSVKNELVYSAAGHNVPIILKTNGGVKELVLNSPPISIWFDSFSYTDSKISFKAGDIVVLMTDGLPEIKNLTREMFGLEKIKKILEVSTNGKDFISSVKNAINKFGLEQEDDITILAFDL